MAPTHLSTRFLDALKVCNYGAETVQRLFGDSIPLTKESITVAHTKAPAFAWAVQTLLTKTAWEKLLERQRDCILDVALDERNYKRRFRPFLETRP